MTRLLDLLAAIALLIWGTQLVRAGVLQAFGENLRYLLARSVGNRAAALLAGLGVTAVVQSSTATALMAASFVGRGVLALPLALAMMLGADIGTSVVALSLSLDLSWLSPLCIFGGVALTTLRRENEIGRILIGLGLMLLALKLIRTASLALTQTGALQGLLGGLGGDLLLAVTVGAVLAVVAYSSLAVVLLTAALAAAGTVPPLAACGIVLGANIGSGLLGVITTAASTPEERRLPLGNLLFKLGGVLLVLPLLAHVPVLAAELPGAEASLRVVAVHVAFNTLVALVFIGLIDPVAALARRLLPAPAAAASGLRSPHLVASALAEPQLALACAAREALHQADVVETMLRGIPRALQHNDLALIHQLRRMDDTVDGLCSAIKAYVARLANGDLDDEQQRRRQEILEFTINMEQVADIAERVLLDVEERRIKLRRRLSPAGLAEVTQLHERLLETLRLGMSVFLGRQLQEARALIDEEAHFRDLARGFAATHLARYADRTPESVETSGLHLDLLSELQRIHAHLCAIGHALLAGERAGARSRMLPT